MLKEKEIGRDTEKERGAEEENGKLKLVNDSVEG